MTQTAVEWLINWMGKNQYFIGNDLLEAVEQAKAMEKEQTVKFAYSFYDNCFTEDGIIQKTAGEYYNETYGGDQ